MVNSCLEDVEGRMRLKRMWKLIPKVGGKGGGEWRCAVILHFGSFTKKELMVNHERSTETWGGGGDKAWKEKLEQDQKGGGGRQRHHQPVCNGKVISPSTQLHHGRFK